MLAREIRGHEADIVMLQVRESLLHMNLYWICGRQLDRRVESFLVLFSGSVRFEEFRYERVANPTSMSSHGFEGLLRVHR